MSRRLRRHLFQDLECDNELLITCIGMRCNAGFHRTFRLLKFEIAWLFVASASTSAQSARRATCSYGEWTAATTTERATPVLNATRFARFSSLANSADGWSATVDTYGPEVVGVAGLEATEATQSEQLWPRVWPPELRLLSRGTEIVGESKDAHWFAFPRSAKDRDGSLHVVWADADGPLPKTAAKGVPEPRLNSVWYSRFRSGKWSSPVLLYRSQSVRWDAFSPSRLTIDSVGHLDIAFPAEDSTSSVLVYLHAQVEPELKWKSHVWKFATPLAYTSVSRSGDSVVIAFTRSLETANARPDVLFLLTSAGHDVWASPREISDAEEEPAIEPHAFLTPHGIHVVWTSQQTSRFDGGKVWHINLGFSNQKPRSKDALALQGVTNASKATIDLCETIHFVVRKRGPDGTFIAYARHDSFGWSEMAYPFRAATQLDLASSRQSVFLVWSSIRQDSMASPEATIFSSSLPIHISSLQRARKNE